jgi:hypothetical protein
MAWLAGADYAAVRAALRPDLEAAALPDHVIALPIYAGAAERRLATRLPTYAAVLAAGGEAAERVRLALVYYTAALLAPAVPRLTHEAVPGAYSYTVQGEDLAAQQARLFAQGDAALALPTVRSHYPRARPLCVPKGAQAAGSGAWGGG